jgi:hypothetical protein
MEDMLTVGDTINWRGNFSTVDNQGKVVAIQLNTKAQQGVEVDSIEWFKVHGEEVIVILDNGSFKYAKFISKLS